MDDPRIRTLDALIKKGQEVGKSRWPDEYLANEGVVNPILFTTWTTQVGQFFMDYIDKENAFVDQFNVMVLTANQKYPYSGHVLLGVRLLQDLMKYLNDKPSYPVSKQVDSHRSTKEITAVNRKVFIVHGQDEKIKGEVEEFLLSIGLEPIILHKQASLGKTIIEKVEHYSDVVFAVILLTEDDFGGALPSGQATTNDLSLFKYLENPKLLESISEKEKDVLKSQFLKWLEELFSLLKPRARQNVIFECGFFIAKLGRDRVAALCEEGIERPSDLDGLLYTPIDQKGEWKKKLAKEIDASGIEIDEKYLI